MLRGIDISNHNIDRSTNKVIKPAALMGEFVIMRASEGKGMRDEEFKGYDQGIRPSSKFPGAYHFSWVGRDGNIVNSPESEATNFAEAIKESLRPGFLVVLDWEPAGSLQWNTDWAVDCALKIRELTGRTPILYANFNALNRGLWARWRQEIGTDYWLAGGTTQYSKMTLGYNPGERGKNPDGWGNPIMWQYTEYGYLDGWHGRLDLNVFYGDSAAWRALTGEASEKPATDKDEEEKITVTESFEVGGAIRLKYDEFNGAEGPLGQPTSDEFSVEGGRVQRFEGGTIFFSWERLEAHVVWGAILDAYGRAGYELGAYGFPIGPELSESTRWVQQFQGGQISFDKPKQLLTIPTIRENDPRVWIETPLSVKRKGGWGCVCMQMTLPLVEAEMKRRGLINQAIDVFQFGYAPYGPNSLDTHGGGGVIDVVQGITREERGVWAEYGWHMAPRVNEQGYPNTASSPRHGHGGMHGCNHRSASLANQVRNMMAGYNGLKSNLRVNWVTPSRTWQESLRAMGLAA